MSAPFDESFYISSPHLFGIYTLCTQIKSWKPVMEVQRLLLRLLLFVALTCACVCAYAYLLKHKHTYTQTLLYFRARSGTDSWPKAVGSLP